MHVDDRVESVIDIGQTGEAGFHWRCLPDRDGPKGDTTCLHVPIAVINVRHDHAAFQQPRSDRRCATVC
jgi:hypothetical protein